MSVPLHVFPFCYCIGRQGVTHGPMRHGLGSREGTAMPCDATANQRSGFGLECSDFENRSESESESKSEGEGLTPNEIRQLLSVAAPGVKERDQGD
jgi:hypothetical protein